MTSDFYFNLDSDEPRVWSSLQEAAQAMDAAFLNHLCDLDEPVFIGVTGAVGSGKSTLANLMATFAGSISSCLVISTDDYLPDYSTLSEDEYDLPEHSHLALLQENLQDLSKGRSVTLPIWTHDEHKQTGSRIVGPLVGSKAAACPPVVIVEGIHALYQSVLPCYDLKIFVQASSEDRWKRWEKLEQDGTRNWGVEKAKAFFNTVADPTFAQYAQAYQDAADWIVLNPTVESGS